MHSEHQNQAARWASRLAMLSLMLIVLAGMLVARHSDYAG
jgi:hypothetical protein